MNELHFIMMPFQSTHLYSKYSSTRRLIYKIRSASTVLYVKTFFYSVIGVCPGQVISILDEGTHVSELCQPLSSFFSPKDPLLDPIVSIF